MSFNSSDWDSNQSSAHGTDDGAKLATRPISALSVAGSCPVSINFIFKREKGYGEIPGNQAGTYVTAEGANMWYNMEYIMKCMI